MTEVRNQIVDLGRMPLLQVIHRSLEHVDIECIADHCAGNRTEGLGIEDRHALA